MKNPLQALVILSLGVGIGWVLKPSPEPVKELVEVFKEPTDDQLLAFWFGEPSNPAKLRKRVCGK